MGGGTQLVLGNTPSTVPYIEIIDNKIISNDGIEEWDISNNENAEEVYDLWGWGGNYYGQIGMDTATIYLRPEKIPGTKWKKIVTFDHTLAIDENNDLWGWGSNKYGQLGLGYTSTVQFTPLKLHATTKWKNVYCEEMYSLAVTEDDILYGWGFGGYGQLGVTYAITYQYTPLKIDHQTKWTNIYCSESAVFVLTAENELYGWGSGAHPNLGSTKRTPVKLTNTKCKHIAHNVYTYFMLSDLGDLFGWGRDSNGGQLGVTPGRFTAFSTPINVHYGTKWKDICSNNYAVYALAENDIWYMWGNNAYYSLGLGYSAGAQCTPIKCNRDPKQVWCTELSTLILSKDNVCYGWGQNAYELGLGHTNHVPNPQIQNGLVWKKVVPGRGHMFGLI